MPSGTWRSGTAYTHAGAHTRAALSPEHFIAHLRTRTIIESSRNKGQYTPIARSVPHLSRRSMSRRRTGKWRMHTARQEKASVVEKGDARLGGGHGDGTYMARIWRAREPASVHWELAWCSSCGLMSGMHHARLPACRGRGRDTGRVGGAPCAEVLASVRSSAVGASPPTSPGDPRASDEREKSAPKKRSSLVFQPRVGRPDLVLRGGLASCWVGTFCWSALCPPGFLGGEFLRCGKEGT